MSWPISRPVRAGFGPLAPVTNAPCLRLKTDQEGQPQDIIDFTAQFERDIPTKGAVHIVQPSSGAEGVWVAFLYMLRRFLGPDCRDGGEGVETDTEGNPICQEWQQFIIMKDWVGPFDGDADLFYYYESEGSSSQVDMGINSAGAGDLNLQVGVDCNSGQCPPAVCGTGQDGGGGGTDGREDETQIVITGFTPWGGPGYDAFLADLNNGLGYIHFAKADDIFMDPITAWPKDEEPWGYLMYELEPVASPQPLSDLLGSIDIDRGNTPSPNFTVTATYEDTTDFPSREFIIVDLSDTPSRLLPGARITNPTTGKEVTLKNPLTTVRWTSNSTADPADII